MFSYVPVSVAELSVLFHSSSISLQLLICSNIRQEDHSNFAKCFCLFFLIYSYVNFKEVPLRFLWELDETIN